jgi:hypothetical protein
MGIPINGKGVTVQKPAPVLFRFLAQTELSGQKPDVPSLRLRRAVQMAGQKLSTESVGNVNVVGKKNEPEKTSKTEVAKKSSSAPSSCLFGALQDRTSHPRHCCLRYSALLRTIGGKCIFSCPSLALQRHTLSCCHMLWPWLLLYRRAFFKWCR